jgi:hypothetical protein
MAHLINLYKWKLNFGQTIWDKFDAPLGTYWGIFWEPDQNPIKHDGNTLGTRKFPWQPFQRKHFEPLINACQAFSLLHENFISKTLSPFLARPQIVGHNVINID